VDPHVLFRRAPARPGKSWTHRAPDFCNNIGPLQPRTHVAACLELAKADTLSQLGREPAPTGLPIGSSYKERDQQYRERQLKEGKEAITREIAERNRRAGWPLTSPNPLSTLQKQFACARLSRPCLPGSWPRRFRNVRSGGSCVLNIITPVTFRPPPRSGSGYRRGMQHSSGNEMWTGIKTRMWSRDSEGATM
jgi:hypothetical protein